MTKRQRAPHSKILRKKFKLILEGEIKDKRRTIEELRFSYRNSWDLGYILGMRSIIEKKDTRGEEEIKLEEIHDKKILKELKDRFAAMSKNKLLKGFDRGYFSSLYDYLTLREAK